MTKAGPRDRLTHVFMETASHGWPSFETPLDAESIFDGFFCGVGGSSYLLRCLTRCLGSIFSSLTRRCNSSLLLFRSHGCSLFLQLVQRVLSIHRSSRGGWSFGFCGLSGSWRRSGCWLFGCCRSLFGLLLTFAASRKRQKRNGCQRNNKSYFSWFSSPRYICGPSNSTLSKIGIALGFVFVFG